MARSRKKLGDVLVGWGVLTQDKLDSAVKTAKQSGKRLGEALVEQGLASEEQVAKGLAHQFGLEYVDLNADGVGQQIDMKAIDDSLIKKYLVLPMGKAGGKMRLIVHDPMNLELLDNLRFRLNMDLDLKLASRQQIRSYIEGHEKGTKPVATDQSLVTESIDRTIDRSVDRSMDKSIDVAGDDSSPVVRLANRILSEAVRMRASDVHIEPMGDRVRLRYRIDGVCIERDNLPKRMQNAVLSRIKLMAGVNIAEKRVPQDGRIKLEVDGVQIDYRVSSCPAYHGESVVLRILRPDAVRIGLVNLGFEPDNLEAFEKIIRRPNGIFLVTGPTGSGKTTTLYSALDVLNRPDRKIITAEDPVEYNFEGINQCQVRESIGLTFPAILRSMLRQAPNIILVGEIRDKEVGEIAIQAALTGHLVFSTLHTNDAAGSIARLREFGVPPFAISNSLLGTIAQRLVRRVCTSCQEAESPDPVALRSLGIPSHASGFTVGRGCPSCMSTGYKGRLGVYEMLTATTPIRALIERDANVSEILSAARSAGMRSMLEDGIDKAMLGLTSVEELSKLHATVDLGDSGQEEPLKIPA